MIQRELKKLWYGKASIRDYELDDAVRRGGIIFFYKDKRMTLTAEELKKLKFQCHKTVIRSKIYPSQTYTLYDFVFTDDKRKRSESKQLKLIK